jgi:hypothetical protein
MTTNLNQDGEWYDTYRDCEAGSCTHDLAHGVRVYEDLLKEDGPYPPFTPTPTVGSVLQELRERNIPQ